MKLLSAQKLFASRLSDFILLLEVMHYEITLGEAWRPQEMADFYASQGRGISNSNHLRKLAVDLNLFKDGKFLTSKEELTEAGELWESLSTDELVNAWGGRFQQVDANHFSVEWQGVR